VCSVWVPCVALPSDGGSSVGPSPLCGSLVSVPCVGPLCGFLVPSRRVTCVYSHDVSRSFTRSRIGAPSASSLDDDDFIPRNIPPLTQHTAAKRPAAPTHECTGPASTGPRRIATEENGRDRDGPTKANMNRARPDWRARWSTGRAARRPIYSRFDVLNMNRIPYLILRPAYSTCRCAICFGPQWSTDRAARRPICSLFVSTRRWEGVRRRRTV